MVKFCSISTVGDEFKYINDLVKEDNSLDIAGNRKYGQKCEEFLENHFSYKKVLLTNSCSSALEICALLMLEEAKKRNIKNPSVIMPSYTFVSTANAFAKFGFFIKFVDINPDTMNLDEDAARNAISETDIAIMTVNYASCSSDLFKLKSICEDNNIFLIEDAAQSLNATIATQFQGSIGDLATLSFGEAKNITCGEGGAIIVNNEKFADGAEIIRDKGTNRGKFFRGEISRYGWVALGGHYLLGDLPAAFLYAQLEKYQEITKRRLEIWQQYHDALKPLEDAGHLEIQKIPSYNKQTAHLFYIKLPNKEARASLINALKEKGIQAFFHFIPLHDSDGAASCSEFVGEDKYTTKESLRILRLPVHNLVKDSEINFITQEITRYYAAEENKSLSA